MAKKYPYKYAQGITCHMKVFERCCSAKILHSIGATSPSNKAHRQPTDRVFSETVLPKDVNFKNLQIRLSCRGAYMHQLPIKLWHCVVLQQMYEKVVFARGGNDSWQSRAFIISDNTTGPRRYMAGSGFAEWAKGRVPGVRVDSSRPYKGAHSAECRTYTVVVNDTMLLGAYLRTAKKQLDEHMRKLRKLKAEAVKRYSKRKTTARPKPKNNIARNYW